MSEEGQRASAPEPGPTATVGRIFKIIRDRGPLSASDVARVTGLAKSTVSVHVDRLLAAGLVRESERPGSRRRDLKVAERSGFVVGVDLGQTHLAAALCDLEAVVVSQRRVPLVLLRETPESVLERASALVEELTARAGVGARDLLGIGVGVPGPVDFARGVPVSPPVMPGWDRYPVAARLGERFGCPAFLDNDVNVMALGERDRGAAEGADSFLFVKIGTGIGAGLVVHGEIFRGAKGAAGDIGHVGLDGDPTPCRCGNAGCLEAVAGGAALEARARERVRRRRSSFLAGLADRGEPLDAAAVARGAAGGDEACLGLLVDSARAVGGVLAKLVNFFNPSLIVVGGGVAGAGERYLASVREAIYRRSTPLATSDLSVKRSALGDACGVVGAAVLVLDEVLSHRNVTRLVGRSAHAGREKPDGVRGRGRVRGPGARGGAAPQRRRGPRAGGKRRSGRGAQGS
ncbi:MAG TPA: ROK family transcriptional regulator [Anaeromyxobacteraceae bacterium]|nr:ROK family transcriptional regulator [Anaeromyxobacteraceae bacterium]